MRSWKFITTHAAVLIAVAGHPDATVADVAERTRITERSAYRALADLQKAGYVRRQKHGRHNSYEVNLALPLSDPMIEKGLVTDLLKLGTDEDLDARSVRLPSA